ncbi:MAG: rRNA maturation RNase YbeY [Deltaproteobacteria bacterium]|nr:rRNA maturation RNase YbeY [Deltaproteobacteria bacterium]
MPILISNKQKTIRIDRRKIRKKAEKLLRDLAHPDAELSILFVNDEEITRLNELYLKRSGPTNVISFPMHSPDIPGIHTEILGDVVISMETAGREAGQEDISLEAKTDWLLVHGILHLLGYDHEKAKDARVMFKKEKELLDLLRRK